MLHSILRDEYDKGSRFLIPCQSLPPSALITLVREIRPPTRTTDGHDFPLNRTFNLHVASLKLPLAQSNVRNLRRRCVGDDD